MSKEGLGVSENFAAVKTADKSGDRINSAPLDFEAATRLEGKDRVKGLQVKGSAMPFGGTWSYDSAAEVLTLVEAPTMMP